MTLVIDTLSLDELIELNDRIVERIKQLEDRQVLHDMMAFNLGETVSFDSKYGRQVGTIVKFNRKTVVVITDEGRKWKVSPHFLSAVKDIHDYQSGRVVTQKQLR